MACSTSFQSVRLAVDFFGVAATNRRTDETISNALRIRHSFIVRVSLVEMNRGRRESVRHRDHKVVETNLFRVGSNSDRLTAERLRARGGRGEKQNHPTELPHA